MGSPLVADGNDATAALVNQFVATPGGKATVFLWYGRIHYDGANWQVDSSTDSAGLTGGALTWDTDHLDITLTDFNAAPVVLVSPSPVDTAYRVQGSASANNLATLRFYARDDGALITTEATDMDAQVFLVGAYT